MTKQETSETRPTREPHILLSFLAGFMTKNSENLVTPDPRKGKIEICITADELTHFRWKDTSTNTTLHDFVLIPGECELKRVDCTPARVLVLKWKEVNQRFFMWLQEKNGNRDDGLLTSVNEILNTGTVGALIDKSDDENDDDENQPQTTLSPLTIAPSRRPPSTTENTPVQQTPSQPSSSAASTLAQLALARARYEANAIAPSITEILTPDNLSTFLSNPDSTNALNSLLEHLPEDDTSVDTIKDVLRSPSFRTQADALSNAIRTGAGSGIAEGFGVQVLGSELGGGDMNGFWKGLERYGEERKGSNEDKDGKEQKKEGGDKDGNTDGDGDTVMDN